MEKVSTRIATIRELKDKIRRDKERKSHKKKENNVSTEEKDS